MANTAQARGPCTRGAFRVAASATWDGQIPAGSTVFEPVHMVDWYPTLLKLADAPRDQTLPVDGLDIWPTLTQGKPSPHDVILLNTTPASGAVRVGDWKLVVKHGEDDPDDGAAATSKKGRRAVGSVELFDLKADPYEKTNRADGEPAKLAQLQSALDTFAAQAAPPKARPQPKNFKVPKVWGEAD